MRFWISAGSSSLAPLCYYCYKPKRKPTWGNRTQTWPYTCRLLETFFCFQVARLEFCHCKWAIWSAISKFLSTYSVTLSLIFFSTRKMIGGWCEGSFPSGVAFIHWWLCSGEIGEWAAQDHWSGKFLIPCSVRDFLMSWWIIAEFTRLFHNLLA